MIVGAYADGGLLSANPSPIGGTWAWVHVDADEKIVDSRSGVMIAGEDGMPCPVSNNHSEFMAFTRCIARLPAGWSGRVYTDSECTLKRFRNLRGTYENMPPRWLEFAEAYLSRLGDVEFVLLGGHPSREDLVRGYRKDGLPVSRWNKWCDDECTRQRLRWKQAQEPVPLAQPGRIVAEHVTVFCPEPECSAKLPSPSGGHLWRYWELEAACEVECPRCRARVLTNVQTEAQILPLNPAIELGLERVV